VANHKSAAKRARQSVKKNARNKSYIAMVKTMVKKFLVGASELKAGKKDGAEVAALFVGAQSALHKAAAKGLIHKNNASRRVGRLHNMLAAPKA
jgi:small subunit ribosomal protein S20